MDLSTNILANERQKPTTYRQFRSGAPARNEVSVTHTSMYTSTQTGTVYTGRPPYRKPNYE